VAMSQSDMRASPSPLCATWSRPRRFPSQSVTTMSCFSLAQSTATYQHLSSLLICVSKIRRTHLEPVCDPVGSYTGAPDTGRQGAVFLQDVDRSQSAGAQVRNGCLWHGMPRVLPRRIGSVEAGCTRRRRRSFMLRFATLHFAQMSGKPCPQTARAIC